MNNTQAKVGDKVLVVAKAERWGPGNVRWYDAKMDVTVGTVGEIVSFDNSGLVVSFPDHPRHDNIGWWYPFFVLVKVEDKND